MVAGGSAHQASRFIGSGSSCQAAASGQWLYTNAAGGLKKGGVLPEASASAAQSMSRQCPLTCGHPGSKVVEAGLEVV